MFGTMLERSSSCLVCIVLAPLSCDSGNKEYLARARLRYCRASITTNIMVP